MSTRERIEEACIVSKFLSRSGCDLEVFNKIYHLSGPIPKLDGGGYRTFEELYDAETAEEFRPSKESQEMGSSPNISINILLRINKSMDILEILKLAV
nr:12836_t:CDS:2 [Entrophospora candida]